MEAPTGGSHFRDEQACQNAIFFGDVPADRQPRALFSTESDFVFTDQLADVLEAHGSLIGGLTMRFGGGVHHLGGSNAASCREIPAAGLDDVVIDEGKNEIGLNPGAIGVDDAEAIGIAIGGQPDICAASFTALPREARFSSLTSGPPPSKKQSRLVRRVWTETP